MKASRYHALNDPLTAAVCEGDVKKVLEFDSKGITNSVGMIPLMVAAREGQVDIVQRLIEAGADVNPCCTLKQCGTKVTALWFAAGEGRTDVVNLLLDAGADPNDWSGSDSDHRTYPLGAACAEGHVEAVKLLLAFGADVNPVNVSTSEDPLKAACKRGSEAKMSLKKKKFKRYVEIVNLLLAAGAKQ
jgi:uncharacterized protein